MDYFEVRGNFPTLAEVFTKFWFAEFMLTLTRLIPHLADRLRVMSCMHVNEVSCVTQLV